MQRVRLRRTALRATPRMNTSTQPPEGAGRSKAAGELTLGLMSGEERVGGGAAVLFCRSEPAREERPGNAGTQTGRVIVDAHRERARSYIICAGQKGCETENLLSEPAPGGVPAMATSQPTKISTVAPTPDGAGSPSKAGSKSWQASKACRDQAHSNTRLCRPMATKEHVHPIFPTQAPSLSHQVPALRRRSFFNCAGRP
jgi:hypothetical protein